MTINKIVDSALCAAGIDLNNPAPTTLPDDGKMAAQAIRILAEQVQASNKSAQDATVAAFEEADKLSLAATDQMKVYAAAIHEARKQEKLSLDHIRQYRMALASEVDTIDKSIKRLQALNVTKVAADFKVLADALANPAVAALIGLVATKGADNV